MKLIYRGTSYDYNPNQARAGNTGYPHKAAQRSQAPIRLIYRGSTYEIDPTAPPAEAIVPTTYQLHYRGATYYVNRTAAGTTVDQSRNPIDQPASQPVSQPASQPASQPVDSGSAEPASVPETLAAQPLISRILPRRNAMQYAEQVHQANLLKNLQHRFEVAKTRGDQNLINLLESELQQIAPGQHLSM